MTMRQGKDGRPIKMIKAICCYSLLSTPGARGSSSWDFATNLTPQCRAFSRALNIEKLKPPLFPAPRGGIQMTCAFLSVSDDTDYSYLLQTKVSSSKIP